MKQLGLAVHNFHDSRKEFPPGTCADVAPWKTAGMPDANYGSNWKMHIMPYVEQNALYEAWQFHGQSGYNNATNYSANGFIYDVMYTVHRCPSTIFPAFSTRWHHGMYTCYTAIAGSAGDRGVYSGGGSNIVSEHGVFGPRTQVKMGEITDGTSNTMMVGEQSNHLRDANNDVILGNAYGGSVGIAVTATGRTRGPSAVRFPATASSTTSLRFAIRSTRSP